MDQHPRSLTIGTFARVAGVHVETIRFYQRKGLLPQPTKPYGGVRQYGASDLARVRFVRSAQRLGFSLHEISGLLLLDDGTHCDAARELGEKKLADVRGKLADLKRIEGVLASLVEQCGATRGRIRCPLIASLAERSD